jgi:hypothetical protein
MPMAARCHVLSLATANDHVQKTSRLLGVGCCGAHYQARARLVIADRVVYESTFVVT